MYGKTTGSSDPIAKHWDEINLNRHFLTGLGNEEYRKPFEEARDQAQAAIQNIVDDFIQTKKK